MGLMDILNQAADVFNQINNAAQNGNFDAASGNLNSSIGGILAGWGTSVKNKYADTSQQIAFTKYLMSMQGSVSGLEQKEMIGLLKQSLEQCGASSTPDTALGEIYPYVAQLTNESISNSNLPTAHSTCPKICTKSREKCEDCLKKRLAILEALYYVDRPEEYKSKFTTSKKPQKQGKRKCTLCGAYINPSTETCEYCGTPVAGVFEEETPNFLSAAQIVPPEQKAYDLLYQYQLEEFERIWTPEYIKVNFAVRWAETAERRQAIDIRYPNQAHDQIWANVKKETMENIEKLISAYRVKMTMSDIYYMADEYHLSVGQYLRGLFEGDPHLTTAPFYRETQRQDQEYLQEKEERRQRHEQRMESLERQRKLNQEFWERRQQSYRAPQYSGGPGPTTTGSCCGNCRYYMVHDNKCAYSEYHYPTGANDYCGDYRSIH